MFFGGLSREGGWLIDQPHGRYSFGPFHLDADQHLLTANGETIALPPKCFDLLCLLVSSPGQLLEKDGLIRTLWPETFVEEANLSNLIALLRKALGDSPASAQYIRTVPKLGYRFVAPVSLCPPADEWHRENRPASQRPIRILVFPFRRGLGVSDVEHLAYSLPEAISTTLAEMNMFTVRSVQVAMRFDPVHWDPEQVGKEAKVDVILTGTLDGCGDGGIHVVTNLIDAPKGTLLWSKAWDVDANDLFRFHQAVVHLLVRSLIRDVRDDSTIDAMIDAPSNPESYALYLRANQIAIALDRTIENIALARDLYLECVRKDPGYAPAWARLGRCYRLLLKVQPKAAMDGRAALQALERAFELNPALGIAHNVCTPIQADVGQAEGAMVRLLRRAESHDSDPELFCGLVQACRYCGQLEASLAAHRRAMELDSNMRTSVAHTYFALADYEQALYWYGTSRPGLYMDAVVLATMGRDQEASALLWSRKDGFHALPTEMNALDAYLLKDPTRAVAVLETGKDLKNHDPEAFFYLARQAAKLDAAELGNDLLEQSVAAGYWSTITMMRDPWLESLRDTTAFRHTYELAEEREAHSRSEFLNAGGERILSLGPG
jgi:DNA-binding winged helix-turn-helix (wHTH) protein/tetratricopeptide (TPR) repeat protein